MIMWVTKYICKTSAKEWSHFTLHRSTKCYFCILYHPQKVTFTFIPSTECYVNNLTFDIFTFGNFQFKKSNFDMATLYIPIFVWRKMILLHFGASFLKGFPGANLAITSYNASVIKIYNTTR
jgi:hypothetical protein